MIHVVIGTKAQLVKMAPIMLEMQNRGIDYNFIFTGQHQETMDDLRENFTLKNPDVILHKGKDVTSIPRMLLWLLTILFATFFNGRSIFRGDKDPKSVVLVHGDTFSTLLGALMGKVSGKRVAHVESGLRSFNLFHPFPEELTRLMTFRLSDLYFCPGQWACKNLEASSGEKIDTVYNTLMDSLKAAVGNFSKASVQIPSSPYAVVTLHRFENIFRKAAFETNLELIELIAKTVPVVFILHPVTQRQLVKFGLFERLRANPRIELRPRYDYFNFMRLVFKSEFLVSDGGSNQEECFYMGKPCLLLRRATERQEGIGGNVVLSEYKHDAVESFLGGYKSLAAKPIYEIFSPTKVIVDRLQADLH